MAPLVAALLLAAASAAVAESVCTSPDACAFLFLSKGAQAADAAGGPYALSWTEARSMLVAPEPHYPRFALALQDQRLDRFQTHSGQDAAQRPQSADPLNLPFPSSASPFKQQPLALIVESCMTHTAQPGELAFTLPASKDDIADFFAHIDNNAYTGAKFSTAKTIVDMANIRKRTDIDDLRNKLCDGACGTMVDHDFLHEIDALDLAASALEGNAVVPERLLVVMKNPASLLSTKSGSDESTQGVSKKLLEAKDQNTQKLVNAFLKIHGDNAAVARLCVPPSVFSKPAPAQRLFKRDFGATCFRTLNDCQSLTNNCSSHGTCGLAIVPGNPGGSCYTCTCNNNIWTDDNGNPVPGYGPVTWTGNACQYQDVSASFHILFWFSIAAIILLVYSIGMLYDIGNPSANGSGAPAARPKTD